MREMLSGFNGRVVLESGTEADTCLHDEDVAVRGILALEPQDARVDVQHEPGTAENVGAESAMSALRHAAIIAERREAGEQNADTRIDPAPRGIQGRLVGRSEQYGVWLAVGAARRHVQRRVINLQAERARLLCIATESHTDGRAAPFHRSAESREDADRRAHRPVEKFGLLARTPERERHVGAAFEGLDGAVRDLKESSLDERGGRSPSPAGWWPVRPYKCRAGPRLDR